MLAERGSHKARTEHPCGLRAREMSPTQPRHHSSHVPKITGTATAASCSHPGGRGREPALLRQLPNCSGVKAAYPAGFVASTARSVQLQQAGKAHTPALSLPSQPVLMQQLQSLVISSHCKHSARIHLFSTSPPPTEQQNRALQVPHKKKSSSDQQTYFFLKFQSKHSLTPWISMYFHPVGFYLLKYKWWECHVSLS